MGFTSLLSKIGHVFGVVLGYAKPILKQVGEAIPGDDPAELLFNAISAAEAVGNIVLQQGGTKLDKLQLVLPYAKEVFRNSELLAGKEIADQALFAEGVQDVINGEVKILKAIKG